MRLALIAVTAFFFGTVVAEIPPSMFPYLRWCADQDANCTDTNPARNNGACQDIPDSNAHGDKYSTVRIMRNVQTRPYDRPCMTLYYNYYCLDRGMDAPDKPTEFDVAYLMLPSEKGERSIFRSYRLMNITNPAVKCDGSAFNSVSGA